MVQQMSATNEKKKIQLKVERIISNLMDKNNSITYENVVRKVIETTTWGAQEIANAISRELDCLVKENKLKYVGRGEYTKIEDNKE